MAATRTMTARYAGRCRDCGATIHVGDTIRYSRATGALCGSAADCADHADFQAESLAEQRMERWAEARFAGTTSSFWEDEDFLRDRHQGGYA